MKNGQRNQEAQWGERGGGQKSPTLAAVFSALVTGLGQVYSGEWVRGLVLFVSLVILGVLIVRSEIGLLFFVLLCLGLFVLWLWNIWDAYNLARGRQISPAIAFLLIAGMTYVIGWRVTEINLGDLITGAPDIVHIVTQIVQPDLLTRDKEYQAAQAAFQVPCADSRPQQAAVSESEPYLVLSHTCGVPGEPLSVEGFNFRPNTRGTLRWIPPVGTTRSLAHVDSDGEGHFVAAISVPQVPESEELQEIETELRWEVGLPHFSETARVVFEKMVETVMLALMATTFAIFIAVPLSFLGARNLMSAYRGTMIIYFVVRGFFNIVRSIEPLIWAIIFAVWVSIGPFAGVLALGMHSIAALGKLYSEQVESIDPGPIEAIRATGANALQTIIYAVVPQIVPPYIAFTIYRWDINVRMSTVIGMVGGGGIGFLLIQWVNLLRYKQAGVAVWAITIVVWVMDYVSGVVREKIV
jgi:phosphonate transport system permease protein